MSGRVGRWVLTTFPYGHWYVWMHVCGHLCGEPGVTKDRPCCYCSQKLTKCVDCELRRGRQ